MKYKITNIDSQNGCIDIIITDGKQARTIEKMKAPLSSKVDLQAFLGLELVALKANAEATSAVIPADVMGLLNKEVELLESAIAFNEEI